MLALVDYYSRRCRWSKRGKGGQKETAMMHGPTTRLQPRATQRHGHPELGKTDWRVLTSKIDPTERVGCKPVLGRAVVYSTGMEMSTHKYTAHTKGKDSPLAHCSRQPLHARDNQSWQWYVLLGSQPHVIPVYSLPLTYSPVCYACGFQTTRHTHAPSSKTTNVILLTIILF